MLRHRRPFAGVTSTRFPGLSGERVVITTHSDTPTQTHAKFPPPPPRSSLPALARSPVNFPQCGCGGRGSSVRLQPRRCAHTRIRSGSGLRDVRREGAAAVVPGPVPGLPGCVHHQHDHVLQRRPGFLRPHPQTQTRSDVSRTECSRLTLRKFCKTVNFPSLQTVLRLPTAQTLEERQDPVLLLAASWCVFTALQ